MAFVRGGVQRMKATHPSEEKFLRKFRKLPDDRKSEVLDFIDFLTRRRGASVPQGKSGTLFHC
jgi:Protein of unknown function (DUF2281)